VVAAQHDVAALHVGAHVVVPRVDQLAAQVGHRDPPARAEVDPAQQRDPRRHRPRLVRSNSRRSRLVGRRPGRAQRGGQAALLGQSLALDDALGRLLVELLGLGRGPAPLGRAADDHRATRLPDGDLELVARPDLLARLDRSAVEVHAAAVDRLRGQGARLDQPRGPEPLVEAHGGLRGPAWPASWHAGVPGSPP
jgi:hypothetical protein